MIDFFNENVTSLEGETISNIKKESLVKDKKKMSWSEHLFSNISRGRFASFEPGQMRVSQYRPYNKTNLYFSKAFNDRQGQMQIFPDQQSENQLIVVTGVGSGRDFSCLLTNTIPRFTRSWDRPMLSFKTLQW